MKIDPRSFLPRKWKAILVVLAAGLMLLVSPVIAYKLTWQYYIFNGKREGDQAREKIEAYRTAHGVLPPDLTTLGIVEREEGPIYYQREGENDYLLWFGTTLGESVTWSSRTRQWRE